MAPLGRIPEATVARLPLYLRGLDAFPDGGTATVSSDELADLAGVNAAKVRKDLSHLGTYGTRGVGYDVTFLRFQISQALGVANVRAMAASEGPDATGWLRAATPWRVLPSMMPSPGEYNRGVVVGLDFLLAELASELSAKKRRPQWRLKAPRRSPTSRRTRGRCVTRQQRRCRTRSLVRSS